MSSEYMMTEVAARYVPKHENFLPTPPLTKEMCVFFLSDAMDMTVMDVRQRSGMAIRKARKI